MKKFFSFIAMLFATLAIAPNAQAQWILGGGIDPNDVYDGLVAALETRSDRDNGGHYVGSEVNSNEDLKYPVAYEDGNEVPQDILWKFVQAEDNNATVDRPQYRLQHVATGKYLKIEWIPNGQWPQGNLSLTDNIEEANKFVVTSANNYDGLNYGSTAGGSFTDVDWVGDGTAITLCEINENVPNGRGWLCNESKGNIRAFYLWQDTNIFTIKPYVDGSDPKVRLNEYINKLPLNIYDEYKYGTDPGFIANAENVDNFMNLLMDAIENSSSWNDEKCTEVYDNLVAYKAILDNPANSVPLVDGAYYYIKTANSAFTAVDNGEYAIYAPGETEKDALGWKAFNENDPRFIWQLKFHVNENGDIRYEWRNAGSGLYINRSRSKSDGQSVLWSTEYTTPGTLKTNNHAGQWYISDDPDQVYPPRPFHQDGHDNGNGTIGRICIWDGATDSPSSWFIRCVPQEQIDKLADMEGFVELNKALAQYSSLASRNYEVQDAPGYISSQEVLDNFKKTYADADTMLNHSEGKTFTDAEYAAAKATLQEAVDAFLANRDRGLADGYYRIGLRHWFAAKNDPNYYMQTVEDGRPGWARTPEATLDQVWKITRIEGNKYSVQNMSNSKYISKADRNESWLKVNYSDAADVPQIIAAFDDMIGQFYFTNGVDTLYHYDDGDHLEGTASSAALRYYNGYATYGGTAWAFIPVSEEEFATIKANDAKVTLGYELADALKTAKRLYNNNTVYTTGDNIVTSVDQLDGSSCDGSEGLLESLIDDNQDTHWASNWNRGDLDVTNYLRFETTDPNGLPDSIIYHAVSRNNGSWHRVPSKLRVSVSNDAENWTELPAILEKADIADWDLNQFNMTPMNTLVTGVKGYKYIRFEFLAVQPHYEYNFHPVGEYSAANILPVTGVDAENSLTQQGAYKTLSDALLSAIKAGQAEVDANAPTEATVELLRKAVADFNNKAVVDSIVAMAKLNIENFTAGERIGEFPEAALDTYKNAAQAALNTLEDKGNAATGDDNEAASKALVEAYDALYPTMVKPEAGKWYVVNSSLADTYGVIMAPGGSYGGHANWSYLGAGWDWANMDNAITDPYNCFVFEANEDGTFNLLNAGTGFYNGPETGSGNSKYDYQVIQWYEPQPLTIVPFGDGQIGFRMKSGRYINYNNSVVMTYTTHDGTIGKDSQIAWELWTAKEDQGAEIIEEAYGSTLNQGRIMPITRSYDMQGVPTDNLTGAPLAGYRIVGRETEEGSADSIVTAYKLQRYDDDAVIPAGTPVIYIVEGEYDASAEKHSLTFHAIVDGGVTSVPDTINGLVGQLDAINVPYEYGYPHADSVNVDPAYQQLGYQRAHIAPWLVKELEGEQVDKIIYVKGAGILNGVANIKIEDAKEIVNVYSVDGILVRRNVKRENAVNGLAKGIYIVGKEKVLVK